MKYEIDVEGLPEGWKPVAYRVPVENKDYVFSAEHVLLCCWPTDINYLIVEKIQPRRIVLEETGEVRKLDFKDFYADGDGFLCRWMFNGESGEEYKIWREVK